MAAQALVMILVLAALVLGIVGWRWLLSCREQQDNWAIGIYAGAGPLQLAAHPAIGDRPVLGAAHIRDAEATFVADPFLLRRDGRWYLFFEVMERRLWRGCIAYATSADGIDWQYGRVVLREPFHLSYPYVFEDEGEVYFVPEAARSGQVRLYRASRFPEGWEFVCELLQGTYYDPSLVRHLGRWWLFVTDATRSLRLFHAEDLRGPWAEHRASPVVRQDPRCSRSAGRILRDGDGLLRFAQDGRAAYGTDVWAFRIARLDLEGYAESEVPGGPVLGASGKGWNASGMHQIDAQELAPGRWIAAVDGNVVQQVINWRAGLRRLQARWLRRQPLPEPGRGPFEGVRRGVSARPQDPPIS